MARVDSPWRALRPVLLAGAAAITWLTLSSAGASADAGPDTASLIGSGSSTVSSLTSNLAAPVSPAPAGSPAAVAAAPGLVPVGTQVTGLADNIIAAVPVVSQVAGPGTVSTVSAPLVDVADGVAQVVVAPAADAVPVLEPAVQPVSDLLTGAAALPLPLPAAPVDALLADLPAGIIPVSAATQPGAVEAHAEETGTATEPAQAVAALLDEPVAGSHARQTPGTAVLSDTSSLRSAVMPADPASEQPPPVAPAPLPLQVPAAPSSDTGSGTSSGGQPGAAAWLSPMDVGLVRPGAILAGETSEYIPAPVSFDPGSSPD